MRPAKNIDSHMASYSYTAEKRGHKKRNEQYKVLQSSHTYVNQTLAKAEDHNISANPIQYCDPTNFHKARKTAVFGDENEVTPVKTSAKHKVIKMSDLKLAGSETKPKYTFAASSSKKGIRSQAPSLQQTPEKKRKRMRGSRGSIQAHLTNSMILSEQKDQRKVKLDSEDVFNMRNSRVMDSGVTQSFAGSKPASLQKRRSQRKTWKKSKD